MHVALNLPTTKLNVNEKRKTSSLINVFIKTLLKVDPDML
jgi:hypothetical protein